MDGYADLAGKCVWITGSSRGIGRVLAEHLASLGANVVMHGTTPTSTRAYGEADSLAGVVAEVADRSASAGRLDARPARQRQRVKVVLMFLMSSLLGGWSIHRGPKTWRPEKSKRSATGLESVSGELPPNRHRTRSCRLSSFFRET